MATQQTGSQSYDNIISGMLPSLKSQQSGMYDYLAQLARRQGTAGAMQQAAAGVAPYAQQVGQAVGQTAPLIAQLKEKERQFQIGQENWNKQFEEQRRQYEQNYALSKEQTDWNQMMAMFQQTGWTPQMMQALGYGGLGGGDMRALNRQLSQLGFQQPGTMGAGAQYPGTLGSYNNWGGRTGLIYG